MLAIAGGKGGVGKTTTTLGLAAALPGRPLAVDADRDMPDLHALAGVNRDPGLDAVLRDGGTPTSAPELERAGATSPAAATDVTSAPSPEPGPPFGQPCPDYDCRVVSAPSSDAPRTDRLLERLDAANERGDESETASPLLVDTPAGVSVDAVAPLQAADGVVLVSTACGPALRDAAKTASMARTVGTPVLGVVLTRTVARLPGIGELLDCPVLGCVPAVSGRPLASSRVRERYEAIATRLPESDGAT